MKTVSKILAKTTAIVSLSLFAVSCSAESESQATASNDSDRLSFSVEVQELSINLTQFFAVAMPGELLEFDVQVRPDSQRKFSFSASSAADTLKGPTSLAWKAPATPGVHQVSITADDTNEVMNINVFVLRPLSEMKDGKLGDYRVGAYPEKPLRGSAAYLPPAGLMQYTNEMKGLKLSPHFTVEQFLCKQATKSNTKYLLVKPALILKLETLMTEVHDKGIEADTFFVMSGYRTPFYNKSIGNVQYSRHKWGDAADIYIDHSPHDGSMDDINKDGKRNRKDAGYLFDLADNIDKIVAGLGIAGGVGEYGANAVHGPFVHIDTRGIPARWGR